VVQGDGSFGLNGFDLRPRSAKLPMVCVVGNDAAWGQIRIPQVSMFGEEKSPGTLLAPPATTRWSGPSAATGSW
jgi:acetolactate synthase-1/2/3 large subunit